MRTVKTLRRMRWICLTATFVAGPLAAQTPPLSSNSAAPAVALTPQPLPPGTALSDLVPKFDPASAPVEQAGFVPAKLDRPFAAPMSGPTGPPPLATSAPPPGSEMALPFKPAPVGPVWRWYGWGAANGSMLHTPMLMGTAAPAPAGAKTESPPKLTAATPEPNWAGATGGPAVSAPEPKIQNGPAMPPNVELNLNAPPRPAPAPPVGTPATDPWTGIAPQGAKALSNTIIARASSNR